MQIAVCISKRCGETLRMWFPKNDDSSFCGHCGEVKGHHEVRGEVIL